jgi:hypothetical protein
VDSLRELSLSSLKCERNNYPHHMEGKNLTLNEELAYNDDDDDDDRRGRSTSLPISYDSPVVEQPPSLAFLDASVAPPSPPAAAGPSSSIRITGQVRCARRM